MILIKKTSSEFASENPILTINQLGQESDTKAIKRGDGVTPWNNLVYSDLKIVKMSQSVWESYRPTNQQTIVYVTELDSYYKFSPVTNEWSPF